MLDRFILMSDILEERKNLAMPGGIHQVLKSLKFAKICPLLTKIIELNTSKTLFLLVRSLAYIFDITEKSSGRRGGNPFLG